MPLQCSFCHRNRNEVDALIQSTVDSSIYICGGCISRGAAALVDQKVATGPDENDPPLPKPMEIVSRLNEYVIGQEQAKRAVSAAVYKHYKRREAEKKGLKLDVEIQKSNILITGPSGCGKTEVARTISRILNVPFYIQDATKLTQAGYVGDDVDIMIQGLLSKCAWDPDRAKWGIVVIDEIDKIARKAGRDQSGYRDVSGEGVQQALLKLLEGSEVTVAKGMGTHMLGVPSQGTVTVDTTNILFIAMGSFDGIQDVIRRRINKGTSVGFGGSLKRKVEDTELYDDMTEDDVLDFGLIPEMVGRLPVLTSVLPLTEPELIRVLTEPKNALIKQFQALYRMDGVELQFEEKALEAIARKAKKRSTGARALRGILEKLMNPWDLVIPDDTNLRALRVTEDFVEGKTDPILVHAGGPIEATG